MTLRQELMNMHTSGVVARQLKATSVSESETLDIRIIAIFVIFAASIIGAAPPLYIKAFKDASNGWARMLRSGGAGIVLCLAVVHVAPYAYEQMGGLSEVAGLDPPYNAAGATIVFGFFMMMIIEATTHGLNKEGCAHGHGHAHMHHNPTALHTTPDIELSKQDELAVEEAKNAEHSPDYSNKGLLKRQVAAHLFELGCAVHSVIIGVALGVNTDNRPVARNYMIALVFHQLIEAVALGAFIAIADLGKIKSWIFILFYSVTVGIGIAIGIGVGNAYQADSLAALATQGTLNGLAVGILLYMATIQMIAEDFSAEGLTIIPKPIHRYGCFASFFICAGIMTFIAIWA